MKHIIAMLTVALLIVGCNQKGNQDSKAMPNTPTTELPSGSSDIIVKIGDQTLTDAQIRDDRQVNVELYKAALKVYQAEHQEYDAYKQAVEAMVENRVLEMAAKEKNVSVDELIKTQVDTKVSDVTENEILAFYEEKKINRPLDTIKDRIKQYLETQKAQEVRQQYIDNLKSKYNVSVNIPEFTKAKPLPPKLEIALGENPKMLGKKDAPITIVAFSDYECPYCKRAEDTVKEVLEKYGDSVNLVFRHYPLPFHKNAKPAHMAAECAQDQGKFWEYHDMLFENQKALSADDLKEYAKKLKLDTDKFAQCLDSKKYESVVDQDIEDGKKYGVTGTPAFFVNGRLLSGAQPVESFVELIEIEKNKS